MRFFVILRISLRALMRNKLRSCLTALGMIIGVGAVIAMVSIGSGARSRIEAQIASLGQNVIQVYPNFSMSGGVRGGSGSGNSLTIEDAVAIRNELPGVAAVSPQMGRSRTISSGSQNWFTQVQGQGDEFFHIREWQIEQGAFFSEVDVANSTKVAVIGATVAEELFPGEDPLGKVIRVRHAPFVVVGVLARKGASISGTDQDDVMYIPISSMRFVQGSLFVAPILVQAASAEEVAPLKEQITALLRQRHRLEADRDDDFVVRTQEEIAAAQTQASDTMARLLAGVAVVSLIVGGIGIMNIMLVSVTERTREIGTRIAVGARGDYIMLQFLAEAVSLSVIGGLLGIGAGVGGSQFLSNLYGWPVLVSTFWATIAVVGSALVGIVFGFFPAYKASRLDPIEALRFE